MAVKNLETKIVEKEKVAENTFRIKFAMPEGEVFEFEPGQFVNILVAPNTRRSYSIASSPDSTAYVETYGDVVAGGPGSQFFLNSKEGDSAPILGPLGRFIYKEADRPAYFFATGTGLTPFLSMIRYALEKLGTKREICLFQGFRYENDVFAEKILNDLSTKYPNFRYKVCVSRPTENWQGEKGRITLCIDEIKQKDIDVYICGSQGMINDVAQKMIEFGVPGEQIYYEQFY